MKIDFKRFITLKNASFNKELNRIYDECKPNFVQHLAIQFSGISMSDIEEIYDDAIMAFYSNIKEGKLTELTCSIQTYINRIGTYKTLDFLKKHQLNFERIPDVETIDYCERTNEYWMTEGDSQEEERKNIIYSLIERLVEPCKKILFSFYYDHFSMEMIAQSMGFATPDVAKTQKSRCMAKVKKAAEIEFQNEGLI